MREFLLHAKIDVHNTRAFKTDEIHYFITIGSVSSEGSMKNIEFKGKFFDVEFGEFSAYLEETCYYLKRALPYVANAH